MKAIRIIIKCAAAGQHLAAGKVFKVPEEVSLGDAERLVRMRRAEEHKPGKADKADDERNVAAKAKSGNNDKPGKADKADDERNVAAKAKSGNNDKPNDADQAPE